MPVPVEPHPLNSEERAVLGHLLDSDFPGAAELRCQINNAEIVAHWGVGSVSIDIQVSGDYPAASLPSGIAPVEATVVDEAGEIIGEIIIWTQAGALSGLEYAWYGEEPPTSLPRVDRIVFTN